MLQAGVPPLTAQTSPVRTCSGIYRVEVQEWVPSDELASLLPYGNLPCPALPYLALPNQTIPYPTLPFPTLP